MSHQLLAQWQGSRFPPGSFPYTDARTGFKFDAGAGGLDDRVKDVQKHRRANPNVYPEPEQLDGGFIRQQIISFMCSLRPELCGEPELPKLAGNPATVVPTVACPQCGALDATPTMCASCGGNRVSFWTCNKCGTKY